MGLFSKKKRESEIAPPAPAPDPIQAMVAALCTALTEGFKNQLDGNAKIAGVFSDFTKSLGELTMRQAAQRLGARGGAASARARKAKTEPQNECALCKNPFTRNLTVAMIERHREHETPEQLALPQAEMLNGAGNNNPES